jgi:prepilin-type N-terminal cleavage/methylation domain-containing protein
MKRGRGNRAFSLTELLVVMGIFTVLMAVSGPAVTALKSGAEFSKGVDRVAGVLRQARSHAITKNTYVWVGFYEENGAAQNSSEEGTGRVILCAVASKDGTRIYEDGATGNLTLSNVTPLTEVVKLQNVNMSDVGAPAGGTSTRLDGRPATPYTETDGDQPARITTEGGDSTPFPIKVGDYTFVKTVRFSPSGEATLNGEGTPRRLSEIGLKPANGAHVAKENFAAIQFAGISGNIQVYRQ